MLMKIVLCCVFATLAQTGAIFMGPGARIIPKHLKAIVSNFDWSGHKIPFDWPFATNLEAGTTSRTREGGKLVLQLADELLTPAVCMDTTTPLRTHKDNLQSKASESISMFNCHQLRLQPHSVPYCFCSEPLDTSQAKIFWVRKLTSHTIRPTTVLN